TWQYCLLKFPENSLAVFGVGSSLTNPIDTEYNRPQVSIDSTATKVFFSWIETDTIFFGSSLGNTVPDLNMMAYDINTNMWTDTLNITRGSSDAWGLVTFMNASYYVFNIPG